MPTPPGSADEISDDVHMSGSPSDVASDPSRLPPPKPTVLERLASALQRARALRVRIERARGRSRALDATLETIERDSAIGGAILAGALAYRLFLFALPLAFVLVSGTGVLAHLLGIEPETIGSDLGLPHVVTNQIADAADSSWSFLVAVTSCAVLAYMTAALVRAVAIVNGLAWEGSAAGVKVSPRAIGVFAAAAAGQLALVAGVGAVREHSEVTGAGMLVVFTLAVAGLWLAVSLELPHGGAAWSSLVPGALLYGVGVVGVQVFTAYLLDRLLESKASTYGALGIAAAILLCFFFLGRAVVGGAVLNATLFARRSVRAHA